MPRSRWQLSCGGQFDDSLSRKVLVIKGLSAAWRASSAAPPAVEASPPATVRALRWAQCEGPPRARLLLAAVEGRREGDQGPKPLPKLIPANPCAMKAQRLGINYLLFVVTEGRKHQNLDHVIIYLIHKSMLFGYSPRIDRSLSLRLPKILCYTYYPSLIILSKKASVLSFSCILCTFPAS